MYLLIHSCLIGLNVTDFSQIFLGSKVNITQNEIKVAGLFSVYKHIFLGASYSFYDGFQMSLLASIGVRFPRAMMYFMNGVVIITKKLNHCTHLYGMSAKFQISIILSQCNAFIPID